LKNVTFGVSGEVGIQGAQGVQGGQGLNGVFGGQGTQGIQGIQGLNGAYASQGIQGRQGIQGTTGSQGIQGVQGTTGSQGIQGIQGIQGTIGTQGTTGTQGSQGILGIQGIQGTQGLDGAYASQGIQGAQGIQGNLGVQGIQGIQGSQGVQGTQGIQGIQGIQGSGSQGIQGLDGAYASQGTQGSQGIQGIQGIQGLGFQGIQGLDGAYASQGSQGTTGTQGTTGSQGTQGIQGSAGNWGGITFDYTFDSSITATDPGAGNLRFNATIIGNANRLYISDQDDTATNLDSIFSNILNVNNIPKGYVRISNLDNPSNYALFSIDSLSSDNGTWYNIVITNIVASVNTFSNTNVLVSFTENGAQGIQGITGVNGSQGIQGIQGPAFTSPPDDNGYGTFNVGINTSKYIPVTGGNGSIVVTDSTGPGIGHSFPSTSGYRYIIESIHVTNKSQGDLYISGRHDFNGGSNVPIANRILVPYESSIELLEQPHIANPRDIIRLQALSSSSSNATGHDGGIDAFIAIASKDDTDFFGVGKLITSAANGTEVYTSSSYPAIIQSIYVTNYSNTSDVDLSLSVFRGGTIGSIITTGIRVGYLAYKLTIPKNSTVELIQRPKHLNHGDTLLAQSSTSSSLAITVSGKTVT